MNKSILKVLVPVAFLIVGPLFPLAALSAAVSNTADAALEEAGTLLDEKDYDAAIAKYNSIITQTKKDDDASTILKSRCYRKIGVAYTLKEQYAEAVDSFQKAIALVKEREGQDFASETVFALYSLARTYETKGDFDKALNAAESALAIAREKMGDSPSILRRLVALKTEIYFSHVSSKLDEDKTPESSEVKQTDDDNKELTTAKPLVGGVMRSDYFKAPALISEVPSLDGMKKRKSLHAKAETTSLKGGTKKVKNKLVQRLLEYGTMGLSLQKDLPGFPWYVKNVLDGGAAQRYGAQKGDILNTIDGHPIVSTPIATIYHMLCGRRGEVRTLGINRSGKDMYLRVQLISVYDIGNRPSEYIEYYWFLLYNGYITNQQYAKLAKPYERFLH